MPQIIDYDLYKVPPRWLFLRLETSDGRVGWGQPTLPGQISAVTMAVEEYLDQFVLGGDALRVEDYWQTMYRGGFHRGGPILMCAIGGIDQALWDLKGKYFGAPVYELLGGKVRESVRTYRYVGGETVDELCEQARTVVDDGWNAIKMHATSKMHRIDNPEKIRTAEERIRAVRDLVGSDVDIAVDCHGRASKSMAKQLLEVLEPYRPMFVEEPLLPEYSAMLPRLAANTRIPIASGERLYSRFQFEPVFDGEGIDIVQPHACVAGGITESKKIATMAETYDAGFAPNHDDGPISFVTCLHLCFNNSNTVILDYGNESSTYSDLLDETPFQFVEDRVTISDEPGLGFEVNIDRIEEQSERSIDWQYPVWRHDDESIAEW